jgi:predicted 2-oxoglutarate/Fe(II)-dependent dioxygenase YbiX
MPSVTQALADALGDVHRPGDFHATGVIALPAPGLAVEGVGPVSLPLLPFQARQLIAVADRAPYGRGQETLVDTEVRRAWQIGPDRVALSGKTWTQTLDAIRERACAGLGVEGPTVAQLYKLLVYDEGDFFVGHRDTEKAPGMFATLVIALPSTSAGGELVVRHGERAVTLNLCCEDPSEVAFAAFYADCVHEVLPITAGARLVLVYNLVRAAKGSAPRPPAYDAQQARLAQVLKAWVGASAEDDAPVKLVYPLAHAYTPAELSFQALKGADAAAAPVVVAAARAAGCQVHLALVTVEESGSAEHEYRSRYRRWSDDEDDHNGFEIGEVYERSVTISDWRRPDGAAPAMAEIAVDEDEFSPPGAFDDLAPDAVHFSEATGNEGATFERTYSRAALILWPLERRFAIISRAGPKVSLPYLADLAEGWAAGDASLGSDARDLARQMIHGWPFETHYWREDAPPGHLPRFLELLTRLGDIEGLEALFAALADHGAFYRNDVPAILDGLALLAEPAGAVEAIIAGTVSRGLAACAALLAGAAVAFDPAGLGGAGTALIAGLPGDPGGAGETDTRPDRITDQVVIDIVRALDAIDPPLAEMAAGHMLAWPATFGFDRVLVAATSALLRSGTRSPGIETLRIACVDHLSARVALPLEPPRDWARPARLGCACEDCRKLGEFLADPQSETWIFKAAQPARSHVEKTIHNALCDLACKTERKGSPHRLICVKTQASHERRVTQRAADVAALRRLEV